MLTFHFLDEVFKIQTQIWSVDSNFPFRKLKKTQVLGIYKSSLIIALKVCCGITEIWNNKSI